MLTSRSSETDPAALDEIELPTETRAARILLVVGEPTLRIAILSRFRLMGIDVEVASNGELAQEKLRRSKIDAVFLDLMLRETDAAKVIKKIRKDKEFKDLPIFGYASSFSARQMRKVIKAGATKVFDENNNSVDVIVAEIGSGLFNEDDDSTHDSVDSEIEGQDAHSELQEAVDRVDRHLEQLDSRNPNELAVGYGEMRGKVQRAANLSMRAGRYDMARLASTLQSLLKVFTEIPDHATESSLHSVSLAVEVLKTISPNAKLAKGPQSLEFAAAIVDDEMVSRSIVCSALRSVGFSFELFSHPAEILRHVSSHKTDLVVVNMGEEETDGFDVCQKLRKQDGKRDIPVLFVSGISDFHARKKVISSGADEVITKPFIFLELALKSICLALRNRFAIEEDVSEDESHHETDYSTSEETQNGGIQPAVDSPSPSAIEQWTNNMNDMGTNRLARHQDKLNRSTGEDTTENFEAQLINDVMNSLITPEAAVDADLQEHLAEKESEHEALGASIDQNDQDIVNIREALRQEQAQREQLEIMVQQLMEAQGPVEEKPEATGNPGSAVKQSEDSPGYGRSPEEVEEELRALALLSDELRVELEEKEVTRVRMNEQFNANEIELSNLRMALEEERKERQTLEAQISEWSAEKSATADQEEALSEALAQSGKLEAQVRSITEELEESKANKEKLSVEHSKMAAELNQKISESEKAIDEARENHTKEADRADSLQKEVERLQNALAEHNQADEQLAVEVDQQKGALEQQLSAVQTQLETSKNEQKRLAEEQTNIESKLSQQFAAANDAAEKAQKALDAETKKTAKLESRLTAVSDKLEKSVAENKKLSASWTQRESTLSKELESSKSAATQAEARAAEQARRAQQLEKELANARQENNAKLAVELEEAGKAIKDSEQKLEQANKQTSDIREKLTKVESERKQLETQLNSQTQALEESRDLLKEQEVRIAKLAETRDQLKQELASDKKRLAEMADKKTALENSLESTRGILQQVQTDSESLKSENENAAAQFKKQINEAHHAIGLARGTARKEAEKAEKFEAEVTSLWQTRDDLQGKLATEQKYSAKLNSRKAELENEIKNLEAARDQAQGELIKNTEALGSLQTRHQELVEAKKSLDSESVLLREQQKTHKGELASMERRVRENVALLTRTTADLETERGERNRIEERATSLSNKLQEVRKDLNQQLQVEKDNQKRISALEKQITDRDQSLAAEKSAHESERNTRRNVEKQLESTGADLEAAKKDINKRLQESNAHQKRVSELEQQLRVREESLVRVTEHLESERGARRRVEEQIKSIGEEFEQAKNDLNASRTMENERSLKITELEEKLNAREEALKKASTALETERNERGHFEHRTAQMSAQMEALNQDLNECLEAEKRYQQRVAQLESEVRGSQKALEQGQSELAKELADRALAEKQIAAAAEMATKLQQYQTAFQESRKSFDKTQSELESRLSQCRSEIADRDERIRSESAQRQKAQTELEALRKQVSESKQNGSVEVSKLQAALQAESMERQRLESEAANSKFISLNNDRSGRALVNGLRKQLQPAVDDLMAAAKLMLEFELGNEQKDVAESVLENAIALQTNVRETDTVDVAIAEVDSKDQPTKGQQPAPKNTKNSK